jgi:hypothetical protein
MEVVAEGFDPRAPRVLKLTVVLSAFVKSKQLPADYERRLQALHLLKIQAVESIKPELLADAKLAAEIGEGPLGFSATDTFFRKLDEAAADLTYWDLAHAFRRFQLHVPEEARQKTFFGQWASARIAAWHHLLRQWQSNNIHIAEGIQVIIRLVSAELPRRRSHIDDTQHRLSMLDQKIRQKSHALAEKQTAFLAECRELEVTGTAFEEELRGTAQRFLPLACQEFSQAINGAEFQAVQAAFIAFLRRTNPSPTALQGTTLAELLPTLHRHQSTALPDSSAGTVPKVASAPPPAPIPAETDYPEAAAFCFEILEEGQANEAPLVPDDRADQVRTFAQDKARLLDELYLLKYFFQQRASELAAVDDAESQLLGPPLLEQQEQLRAGAGHLEVVKRLIATLESAKLSHCIEIFLYERPLQRLVAALSQRQTLVTRERELLSALEDSRRLLAAQVAASISDLQILERRARAVLQQLRVEISQRLAEGAPVLFVGSPLLVELQALPTDSSRPD